MTVHAECRRLLEEAASCPDEAIDLAGAALALAALDDPQAPLARYRAVLADIARAVGEAAAGETALEQRIRALNEVLVDQYRFCGDERDYDNLDNADLMRVIDRRKGLPVTLGILYLHAARAQGWVMDGLAFPAHFLVRLEDEAGHRAILDPFHGGRTVLPPDMRELLKALSGQAAELEPAHYAPVGNRDILLRLQNNIKLRLLRAGRLAEALRIVEGMLLFAPDSVLLWREAGMIHLRLDNLRAAIAALEQYVARAPNSPTRHRTSVLLQELHGRLQ